MNLKHIVIGLCAALLLAPGVLAGTQAGSASGHVCSGDMDFDCMHMECVGVVCAWLFCWVYIDHSDHLVPVPSCVPS